MGLEDWMMVEDADDDAPQQRGGGEGVEKKSKTTDGCVSKASKEQALLTSYQLGPFPLSHRLPQSTNQNSKMPFLISIVHFGIALFLGIPSLKALRKYDIIGFGRVKMILASS